MLFVAFIFGLICLHHQIVPSRSLCRQLSSMLRCPQRRYFVQPHRQSSNRMVTKPIEVKTLADRQYPPVPASSSGKTEVWNAPNVMIGLTSTIVTTTAAAVGATPIAIDCTSSAPATGGVTSTNSHVISTPIGMANPRLNSCWGSRVRVDGIS